MLKRYANLQPENLHKFRERKLLEQERLAAANSECEFVRAIDWSAPELGFDWTRRFDEAARRRKGFTVMALQQSTCGIRVHDHSLQTLSSVNPDASASLPRARCVWTKSAMSSHSFEPAPRTRRVECGP
jgi:hypothetical protein